MPGTQSGVKGQLPCSGVMARNRHSPPSFPSRTGLIKSTLQAELSGLTLVSLDLALQAFPCRLLW